MRNKNINVKIENKFRIDYSNSNIDGNSDRKNMNYLCNQNTKKEKYSDNFDFLINGYVNNNSNYGNNFIKKSAKCLNDVHNENRKFDTKIIKKNNSGFNYNDYNDYYEMKNCYPNNSSTNFNTKVSNDNSTNENPNAFNSSFNEIYRDNNNNLKNNELTKNFNNFNNLPFTNKDDKNAIEIFDKENEKIIQEKNNAFKDNSQKNKFEYIQGQDRFAFRNKMNTNTNYNTNSLNNNNNFNNSKGFSNQLLKDINFKDYSNAKEYYPKGFISKNLNSKGNREYENPSNVIKKNEGQISQKKVNRF